MSTRPLAQVEVVKRTWVVAGGTAHERWRVRVGDAWVDAEAHPTAKLRMTGGKPGIGGASSCEPGEQYRCEIHLELPLGTVLARLTSRPRDTKPSGMRRRRPVLAWLRSAPGPAARLHTREQLFVVQAGGRLERRWLQGDSRPRRPGSAESAGCAAPQGPPEKKIIE